MNIDNLHDALGLLDDEFIEEVETLRSRQKNAANHHRMRRVLRYVPIAACLLICIISIYAVGGSFINILSGSKKSDSNETAKEEFSDTIGGNTTEQADQDGMPSQNSGVKDESSDTAVGESTTGARELKLEVTKVTKESIIGIVKESDNVEEYSVGMVLKVMLPTYQVEEESGIVELKHKDNSEDDMTFPLGSVLTVRFTPQENTQPNDGSDATHTEDILYPDEVTLE